jgi:hypothetical protein
MEYGPRIFTFLSTELSDEGEMYYDAMKGMS